MVSLQSQSGDARQRSPLRKAAPKAPVLVGSRASCRKSAPPPLVLSPEPADGVKGSGAALGANRLRRAVSSSRSGQASTLRQAQGAGWAGLDSDFRFSALAAARYLAILSKPDVPEDATCPMAIRKGGRSIAG